MPQDINSQIAKLVVMYRSLPHLSEQEIYRGLLSHGVERSLASRLIEFAPTAYCHIGLCGFRGVRLSRTFRRVTNTGLSKERPLSSEPVWRAVMQFARAETASGVSKMDLFAVARHSAEFNAIHDALANGIDDLTGCTVLPLICFSPAGFFVRSWFVLCVRRKIKYMEKGIARLSGRLESTADHTLATKIRQDIEALKGELALHQFALDIKQQFGR